mmetsp:Transcript_2219/g.4388  ORF Transcript_2219/g.4388 Transcript_2219/m.4388 type:complete len:117 (-) Transcript_2219:458-808(-)
MSDILEHHSRREQKAMIFRVLVAKHLAPNLFIDCFTTNLISNISPLLGVIRLTERTTLCPIDRKSYSKKKTNMFRLLIDAPNSVWLLTNKNTTKVSYISSANRQYHQKLKLQAKRS